MSVGFRTKQFAVRSATPEVGTVGVEEGAGKPAEGEDELVRIAALESSAGEFEEKFLKRLLRMRLHAGRRISVCPDQSTPIRYF
jgi:hypothetical protein